jgi:hypothetical protein
VRVHNGVHPIIRAYLLGLLHARLGDHASAHRYATELAGACGVEESAGCGPLARCLAGGLASLVASQRGETLTALEALDRATMAVGYDLTLASPYFGRSFTRFLGAALLGEHGRLEESLRLYASFAEVAIHDLVFLAPSHLRRAELLERAGDADAAAAHRARAAGLWHEADPGLRPHLPPAPEPVTSAERE